MAATAFDTLDTARSLKAAGIEADHAEAIAGVMGQSHNQLVTVEHFDARIDAVRTELRAEIMRAQFVSVGIIIAAMALMMTILGLVLTATLSTLTTVS